MGTTNYWGLTAMLLLCACSGGEGDNLDGEPAAIALLVAQDVGDTNDGCPIFKESQRAFERFSQALASGEADVVGIANVRVVEECSGAGGTHVFSSATADGKRFWLGRHACWLEFPNPNLATGVIVGLGVQTNTMQQGEEGWCMQYPGESATFSSDIETRAMAWFASEADAARFLDAL
jgi:hypothetical protein